MPRLGMPTAPALASPFGRDTSAVAPPADSDTLEAPEEPETPLHVGRVRVEGNRTSDSLRVLRTFEVFSGQLYSDEAVRRGIRKLFALGIFEDISTDRDEHDGLVDLVIHVRERPHIGKFVFHGNKKKDNSDLEKKLFLRVGEAYSPTTAQTQVDSLLLFYRDEGYAQARITANPDTLPGGAEVALRFEIEEGEKVKIQRIVLVGVTGVPEKKLRKEMKTKPHGFFGGGDVKDENFDEDRQKIEAYYHNHGYRDARVTGHELTPGESSRRLVYHVTVDEGRRYRFGRGAFSGQKVISDADLAKLWRAHEGDVYDASKIDHALADAYAAYQEKGYLYLNLEPRETVRDSVVDVTFAVTEGQPSRVRFVNVTGNHGTREKVVRRMLAIHEGDQFKRSSLVRTQEDVFRLGIFEDVQMDFTPAESTDVDINVKVKEKQVGTASAGAGYTSEAGLTGFLELGHNNVLGNAQSLQLHLERGSKRSDYFLSFTEPWFHDTPTLLGFSAFNSAIDRDFYQEKRVGASGQIGRPLRKPDYSRIQFSYQLEDLTYDRLSTDTTTIKNTAVQDSITLEDINPGRTRLLSTATVTFTRNSTNNPFYPTHGTRFTLSDEFTGGPLGGTIAFHKHRAEGRIYLPSLTHKLTTMLRARVGLVGEYPGEDLRHVPAYERFRLGGGSTIDPLRGYDDYQIVPAEFDRIVQERHHFTSSTGADSVVLVPERVRYPGGRIFTAYTMEQQFPIVNPLHGVLFFDAGNTWDQVRGIRPLDLKLSSGFGFRIEIPLLGNIGFDYGYGFDRDDHPRWVGHFLLGNVGN
jgi:outer membrane protein insertion porin family